MSGAAKGAACIYFFIHLILTKWLTIAFMIHSTNEEPKTPEAPQPSLLDTSYIGDLVPCSGEAVV